MKRIQEKVKDIVDVRAYQSLKDFAVDPVQTVKSYHFTDATSELMAAWIDRIASAQQGGAEAFALAGYRGVGKSHFLATLAALVSQPELRSKITDSRVLASAQRLSRRHYPVAYVRRGTHDTLLDEFKHALAAFLACRSTDLGDSLLEMLTAAAEKAGELTFILMIDTALERDARVSRDDGPFLSEIAAAAKGLNIFIGVALDDDIAGADGLNSAIARSFAIDYLDQEHLYKVVNSHVFPKAAQMQPALQNVYAYFREVLPHFRWSEQRFAALYPLHPVILEIAPFVRLYVQDFALLGFASAAAERILGRPANSLIALDEVFDSAEKALRTIEDLEEAFAAYDKLNSEVVGKIPVMQRLQAKLILKALLLLSLKGEGTTAGEISAAMLIFDEENPAEAVATVRQLIEKFATALPEHVRITESEDSEVRYGFKVASKDNLNKALAERAADLSESIIDRLIRAHFISRFSDCSFDPDPSVSAGNFMECRIAWRGGYRRGRVVWQENGHTTHAENEANADWEVIVSPDGSPFSTDVTGEATNISRIYWRHDSVRGEEIDTLRRYHVLSTNHSIRETFSDQIRASLHSHSIAVQKIINRIFLEDGKLVIDGFDYNCTEDARGSETLAELFGMMLEPLFETRYPDHPYFKQNLGPAEVSAIIGNLYAGARQQTVEFRQLIECFAVPLNLARSHEGLFVPETEATIISTPLARKVLKLVEVSGSETVSLRSIYSELRKAPHGLAMEAQHLLLASLVGIRQIEFITSKGDRIGRRSLDLAIIWDDIVGIAKPTTTTYNVERLLKWAKLLTGADIYSLDDPADMKSLRSGLKAWLDDWKQTRVLERFNEVPDQLLNTAIWRLTSQSARLLGSLSENIDAALSDTITLEECLIRATDLFSDSEDQFVRAKGSISVVDAFTQGVTLRSEIQSYLACSDFTDNAEIEETRNQLFRSCDASFYNPSEASNRELGYLWTKFLRSYTDHFMLRHEEVMNSFSVKSDFDEVLRSDDWWEFENLSRLPLFDLTMAENALRIKKHVNELGCSSDLGAMIKSRPFCSCSFSLEDVDVWSAIPRDFHETVLQISSNYKQKLKNSWPEIRIHLKQVASQGIGTGAAIDIAEIERVLEADDPTERIPQSVIASLQHLFSQGNGVSKIENASPVNELVPVD